MRILLVDDQPDVAQVLAKGLREQYYAVDIAFDGEAALYQASINDYDLILLDVLMPRKNGIEVCRSLRADGLAVPILMLTARDPPEAQPYIFASLLPGGQVQNSQTWMAMVRDSDSPSHTGLRKRIMGA